MKAKKTDPMKRFLKKYPFLKETERVYRTVDAAVGAPEPIQLPPPRGASHRPGRELALLVAGGRFSSRRPIAAVWCARSI